jgi:hypothetical protein
MLKKPLIVLLSNMIAMVLITTTVFAAPHEDKTAKDLKTTIAVKEAKQDSHDEDGTTKPEIKAAGTVTTVTYDTYGGQKGYTGLLKAFENVKDKPAGEVIAALLLKKYGITVTSVTYNTYGNAVDAIAIADFAAILEASGEVESAADLQKEAIKADKKNLELYKKMGKLNAKLNKAGVKAYVNGEEPKFDVAPFIKEGRALVPFRAISEALKAEVLWNETEKSVTVTKNGIIVKLVIDSTTAYIDGKKVTLDVPAEIRNGRTVVPIRFISEALKTTVKYELESKSIVIYDEN